MFSFDKINFSIMSGAIAGIFSSIMWFILPILHPGYNPIASNVSLLALGPFGWIQTIVFFITGFFTFLFAFAVNNHFKHSKNEIFGKLGAIFLAISAIGLICAGVFTTDPSFAYHPNMDLSTLNEISGSLPFSLTLTGFLHKFFASFIFIGISVSILIFSRYFSIENNLKWKWYSIISAIVSLLAFIILLISMSRLFGLDSFTGLIQRVSLFSGLLWIVLFSFYLLKNNNIPKDK